MGAAIMKSEFEPELTDCVPHFTALGGWDAAEAELLSLKNYACGWDGDDAPVVSGRLIQSTLNWLRQMRDGFVVAPDAIAPTFGGTIMLEWFKCGGAVTSAEVRVPERAEVLDWEPDRSKRFSTCFWTDSVQFDSSTHAEVQRDEPTAMSTSIALAA